MKFWANNSICIKIKIKQLEHKSSTKSKFDSQNKLGDSPRSLSPVARDERWKTGLGLVDLAWELRDLVWSEGQLELSWSEPVPWHPLSILSGGKCNPRLARPWPAQQCLLSFVTSFHSFPHCKLLGLRREMLLHKTWHNHSCVCQRLPWGQEGGWLTVATTLYTHRCTHACAHTLQGCTYGRHIVHTNTPDIIQTRLLLTRLFSVATSLLISTSMISQLCVCVCVCACKCTHTSRSIW